MHQGESRHVAAATPARQGWSSGAGLAVGLLGLLVIAGVVVWRQAQAVDSSDAPQTERPSSVLPPGRIAIRDADGSVWTIPAANLKLARAQGAVQISEEEYVAAKAAQRQPPPEPPAPTPPQLTSDDQLTISMACGSFQLNGDVPGLRACKERQLSIAAGSSPVSLDEFPSDMRMTIHMACGKYQMDGDLAGHRACLRQKAREALGLPSWQQR